MRALLKTGRVGMEDRWFGNAFQIFEATETVPTDSAKAYAKLITSTNRRHSDGTLLDGRHGVTRQRSGSSWRCITKCDTLSWFDLTRFYTTVRVSKEE